MKGILKNTLAVLAGVVAIFGLTLPNAAAHTKEITKQEGTKITATSPLYLDHAVKIFGDAQNPVLSQHESHYSHSSHESHHSHYSHRSGY